MPRISAVSLSEDEQRELEALARIGGWRLVPKEQIPAVFPAAFRAKLDSAYVVASGTPSGVTHLMCNALRVDAPANAIDQEPFAISVHPSGASHSGMFLHHGDWNGRTEHVPEGFWEYVTASGVGNYFVASPPSGTTEGPLDTLPLGNKEAFEAIVRRINEE